MMADMATGWGGVDHHHVPRPDEAAEDCLIGIGAANGPYLAMVAFEKDLQIILQPIFDFIDERCPPVIPFSRMPFRISVGKIGTGLRSGPMTHHVFAGDEVDASFPPSVLLQDKMLDFRYFLLVHKKILPFLELSCYYIALGFASQTIGGFFGKSTGKI